ncbi:MAG: RDD family protein [Pseudomonadales bacterium]|nr:RDD family protein [Pseudomonadales bacterium]
MNDPNPISGTSNPYAPPSAAVGDITSPGLLEKASRLTRLGAALIDGIAGLVLVYGPLIALGGLGNAMASAQSGSANPFAIFQGAAGVGAIIGFVVFAAINFVLVQRNSQTIGKKLLNIKVVRTDGSHATLGRIFAMRNLPFWIASVIPFVNLIVGLVDPLMIFGSEQKCLHDRVADTIVVKA